MPAARLCAAVLLIAAGCGSSTDAAINAGDLATTFRWHTPRDGPTEAPSGTMSLLPTPAEARAGLGAELSITAVGVSTRAATVVATAVVTASTGAAMTVTFGPSPGADCVPDGSLFLRSDGEDGRRLAALGPPPFRYDVSLSIAGRTYLGTGSWSQDQMPACSPCTRLHWDPPLPAF